MIFLITLALSISGVMALLFAAMFAAEIFAAFRGKTPHPPPENSSFGSEMIGVIVPAHNEAGTIGQLLSDLSDQLPLSRVLVVADNCQDETAAIGRRLGACVTERQDETNRGKGYALAHGMDVWAEDPPKFILFLDADCRIALGFVETIALRVLAQNRPVQAKYLMEPHPNAIAAQSVSAFAWYTINALRQMGLSRFGLPVRLNGTGMALPWRDAAALPLAHAHLVEDMMMGIDLALSGRGAVFEPDAVVTSTFPPNEAAEITQRQRWEGGQRSLFRERAIDLLKRSVSEPRFALIALDLGIPPLTRFLAVLGFGAIISFAWWGFAGPALPAFLWTISVALLGAGLTAAFWLYRQQRAGPITPRALLAFFLMKAKLISAGRAEGWVRTGRDHDAPAG